jgi:2-C-methyl-D-erythritol 4-phosphate cytidylyltransferase
MKADSIWAVVPAAGTGSRMQAAIPKQYLPLSGRPILLRTLERLCTFPGLSGLVVGIARDDSHWPGIENDCRQLPRFLGHYTGGVMRADTVLNGLRALPDGAREEDWVLVHDAVRPCVRHADIDKLVAVARSHRDGGLLALPMAETVKRADHEGAVLETVPRNNLWRALTPQLFRMGRLRQALERASAQSLEVTDEASAIERMGDRPRVVTGHPDNIKVTLPADLELAELYLARQKQEGVA